MQFYVKALKLTEYEIFADDKLFRTAIIKHKKEGVPTPSLVVKKNYLI